jgi:predicted CxxxxCH...CXXCH cytochrome family protein
VVVCRTRPSSRSAAVLAVPVMLLALTAGCASQRAGVKAADDGCTYCHGDPASFPGDPLRSAAPPQGVHLGDQPGATETNYPGVGAHQAHLREGALTRALDCAECHVVPMVDGMLYTGAPGHLGGTFTGTDTTPGRAELTFGGRAVLQGVAGGYDRGTFGCDTYCHGVTLAGGTNTRPSWNVVGQGQAECGSCHGLPPDKPGHPQSTQCSGCHPTVDAAWNIIDKDRHIDGTVDLVGGTCTTCHGDPAAGNSAPPVGTHGESQTAQAAVGAHQQHLGTSAWHRSGQCVDCHVVPTSTEHANGQVDFAWGAPANADGASPAFTAADTTCTNVYCHGTTLLGPNAGGVVARTPVWTTVDGSFKACGTTCHTTPPGGSHPQSTACATCHGAVIASFTPGDPPTVTWADAQRHIDGTVDVVGGGTCTSCHGNASAGNAAPPVGTHGETQTSQAAVGAHQQHLGTSSWHRDGQCVDCHVVPTATAHANGQVDFAWGAPANADGASPAFVAAGTTCTNVYCHGSTLLGANSGGTVSRTPVWTTVDGTFDACGTTCHTNPPGGTHPQNTQCQVCHGHVIAAYTPGSPPSVTWANAQLHVDGTVNAATGATCTSCHGDSGSGSPAPPLGVGGETATNTLAVGRHAAHLTASASHIAFACDTCHTVPTAGDLTHTTGYVGSTSLATAGHHGDVTFSGRGAGATWNVGATQGSPVTARGTCTGACHSNGRGGPPAVTPYWAGGTWTSGCGNCHAASPSTGRHSDHAGELSCTGCHPSGSSTHMNGQHDVNGTITGLPGQGGGSITTTAPPNANCGTRWACSGTCHGETHSARCW